MTEAEMGLQKLPLGWVLASIGDILEPSKQRVDPSKISETIYVGLEHIEKDTGKLIGHGKSSEVRSLKAKFFRGDLLYGKLRPYLNKAYVADFDGVCSTDILVFPKNEYISNKYLLFRFLQEDFVKYANQNASGVQHPRVDFKKLSDFSIPIAPLSEQHRIVARIEELFSRLDAGVEALQRARAQLRRYRQAVLKAAVEGRLTEEWRKAHPEVEHAEKLLERILKGKQIGAGRNHKEPSFLNAVELPQLPEGWVWATLSQIGELNRGISKHRPRDDPKLYGGSYPFIQTGDVRDAQGILRSYNQTYNEEGLKQSRLWPKGTLLITIAANIADTAILGFDACFPDSIVGFLTHPQECNIQFVELFIRTAKENIERYAPATAQKNINLRILSELAVPFPPVEEQDAIAKEVERFLSIADEIENVTYRSLKRADRLRESILKRAFEGKLALHDPIDEPASILIKRILEEKVKRKRELKPFKRVNRRDATMPRTRFSLHMVLVEAKTQLTPHELFYKAGFTDETIDEFYQELRDEVNKLRIIEIRPNEVDVYLKVVENENK